MWAVAYVNHGRWVADCPRRYCNSAMALDPLQVLFRCEGGCGLAVEITWPEQAADIFLALDLRPVPATRNWAPAGHRQAVSTGFPDGQSLQDLYAETATHAAEMLPEASHG